MKCGHCDGMGKRGLFPCEDCHCTGQADAGAWLSIIPLLWGGGRILDTRDDPRWWEYQAFPRAVYALNEWALADYKGEPPDGWIRASGDGDGHRRRRDGDPKRERHEP